MNTIHSPARSCMVGFDKELTKGFMSEVLSTIKGFDMGRAMR